MGYIGDIRHNVADLKQINALLDFSPKTPFSKGLISFLDWVSNQEVTDPTAYAWLDTGTHTSLLDASNFVRTLTERQGLQVGSPDEVAYQLKWITKEQLQRRAEVFGKTKYGQYLVNLIP